MIAGSYFILDVSGAFGDWGQPSGISQSEYNESQKQKFLFEHRNQIKDLKFKIDYEPGLKTQRPSMYMEERTMQQDNTRVATPKIIFIKD